MNAIGILYYETSAVVHGGIHSQASAGEAFSHQTHENAKVKDEHVEEFLTQEVGTKDETTEVKLEEFWTQEVLTKDGATEVKLEEFWTQEVITKDETTEVKLEDPHITETQVCFMKPFWQYVGSGGWNKTYKASC